MIVGRSDTNYGIGIETSGVFAISYTLNSCARHARSVCSSKIS
jgi:hypothetical protein